MLSRKILAASLSDVLSCILLGFFLPNPFGDSVTSISHYFKSVLLSIPEYLLYGIPLLLVYGIIRSIISEKISIIVSKKVKSKRSDFILSGLLHASFGLVFSGYGLVASLLFFSVDSRIKNSNFHISRKRFIQALILPFAVYVFCLDTLVAVNFFSGSWKDVLV